MRLGHQAFASDLQRQAATGLLALICLMTACAGGPAPRLSPTSTPVGETRIYVVNADGNDLVDVATMPGSRFSLAWSPDGLAIAIGSELATRLVNLSDGETRRLSATGTIVGWSPDGGLVVVSSHRETSLLPVNGAERLLSVPLAGDVAVHWLLDGDAALLGLHEFEPVASSSPGLSIVAKTASGRWTEIANVFNAESTVVHRGSKRFAYRAGRFLRVGQVVRGAADEPEMLITTYPLADPLSDIKFGSLAWSPDGRAILLPIWEERRSGGRRDSFTGIESLVRVEYLQPQVMFIDVESGAIETRGSPVAWTSSAFTLKWLDEEALLWKATTGEYRVIDLQTWVLLPDRTPLSRAVSQFVSPDGAHVVAHVGINGGGFQVRPTDPSGGGWWIFRPRQGEVDHRASVWWSPDSSQLAVAVPLERISGAVSE